MLGLELLFLLGLPLGKPCIMLGLELFLLLVGLALKQSRVMAGLHWLFFLGQVITLRQHARNLAVADLLLQSQQRVGRCLRPSRSGSVRGGPAPDRRAALEGIG
ncbi:MAG: hypothetical protein C4289_08465 [Chloroflexota bacterium]